MTTHLMKPGMLISDMRTRCGQPLISPGPVGKGKGKPKKAPTESSFIGSEDGIKAIDCAGCLQDLIVDMRLQAADPIGFARHEPPTPEARWLAGGETGTSSITIWHVMTGQPMPVGRRPGIPHDPSDFRRCHELLELFPAWRPRLPEVAARYPVWTQLVKGWDEMTALYLEEAPTDRAPRLYALMREIEARAHGE